MIKSEEMVLTNIRPFADPMTGKWDVFNAMETPSTSVGIMRSAPGRPYLNI